jgi:hypothetical protein
MVIIAPDLGPCGSYGDLFRATLIYKEEEALTIAFRDSSKKNWAW